MIAFDKMGLNKATELIRDLLNKEYSYNLEICEVRGDNPPDLWQGEFNKRNPRVACEIKGSKIDQFELLNKVLNDCQTIIRARNFEIFYLIIFRKVNDYERNNLIQAVKHNSLREPIKIIDLANLQDLANKHRDITEIHLTEILNWYEAYDQVANLLKEFYTSEKRKNPANDIYQKLANSEYYSLNSKRIFQYTEESIVKGLDPIQIYATFNYSRISSNDRITNLNYLFEAFGSKFHVSDNTNFKGIPTPIITSIIYNRKNEIQNEIWSTFYTLYTKKFIGLKQSHFKKLAGWHGIGIPAFTIFLFWIDSEVFLPLDQNTSTFIVGLKVVETVPKTFNEYKRLCEKILKSSNDSSTIRTIVREAYDFIPSGSGTLSSELIQTLSAINNTDIITETESSEIFGETLKQNFKLIAIRPKFAKNGEKQTHIKNLHENTLYQLYHYYEFLEDDMIRLHDSASESLYSEEQLEISISAIVGKNGSGKSTISELLFLIINKISKLHGFPSGKDLEDEPVYADLFFKTDRIYRLTVGETIQIWDYRFYKDENVFRLDTEIVKNKRDLAKFNFNRLFYNIVVNYSPYGLNSSIIGTWINSLFDKNDGYQIPIAFNPKRKEGSINVLNEEVLAKSRMLSNILEPKREELLVTGKVPELISGKIPSKLSLEIDKAKLARKREEFFKDSGKKKLSKADWNEINGIFEALDIGPVEAKKGVDELKEYIYYKLNSISEYSNFKKYRNLFNRKSKGVFVDSVHKLYQDIINDETHATFKIKQAFNYLRFAHFTLDENNDVLTSIKKIESIQSEEKLKKKKNGKYKLARTIEYVPPSIFKVNVLFEADVISERNSFNELSSGEKQQILSINTIAYHLYNINSVEGSSESLGLVKYNSVNILFDEVELCFHPDMQRSYIDKLLKRIKALGLGFTNKLNLCFITHSPFILSDIPSSNILKLADGYPEPYYNTEQTFAANVHDLLANEFFLDQGFMGEYSKNKINEIIQMLSLAKLKKEYIALSDNKNVEIEEKNTSLNIIENKIKDLSKTLAKNNSELRDIEKEDPRKLEIDLDKYMSVINFIGEPVLKTKLMEMFDEARGYDKNTSIKREIERLQKLIN